MSIEKSRLFSGFNLRDVQESIHLVTSILVELSDDQNSYIGLTPKPLTGDQIDTVRNLAQGLRGTDQHFQKYFITFMNNVVGLKEGRHFTWPDERIRGAIEVLDIQIRETASVRYERKNPHYSKPITNSVLQTPANMTNAGFSERQQPVGSYEQMQLPVTPQEPFSLSRPLSYTTNYQPGQQQQTRPYSCSRATSSSKLALGFDQRQEYHTPFPPYSRRRSSSGSAYSSRCSGQRELPRAPGSPSSTSHNGSTKADGQTDLFREQLTLGYAPTLDFREASFKPNASYDITPDGSQDDGTVGPPVSLSNKNNPPTQVTPKTNADELASSPQQTALVLSTIEKSVLVPPVNASHGQQNLPIPSVGLRSPFVPTFRTREQNSVSRRSTTGPTGLISTLVDAEPTEKNRGKRRGELPVEPSGGLDRSPAVVGSRDPTKLVIQYDTRKVIHKRGTPQLVKGAGAFYRYPHRMDWNSKENIKKLNAWREQIHRRQFDRKRKTRHYWLESEKVAVLEAFETHLQERALRGKNEPLWNRLANTYNARYYNRIQRTGSRFVADGRAKGDGLMDRDRLTPWRTANSLLGISKKWPELKTMLMNLRNDVRDKKKNNGATIRHRSVDDEEYSDDEEMIDPDQRLPTTNPADKPTKRSTKRKVAENVSLVMESDEESVSEDLGAKLGESFGDGMSPTGYTSDGYVYDAEELSDY